jgi:hypothetical protein
MVTAGFASMIRGRHHVWSIMVTTPKHEKSNNH